jgi:ubiquinone/menaquinone biosynthesis C-methylase UbiE
MTSRWTALFDEVAPAYDEVVPFFATFGEHLVRHCDLRPGQRVLDVAAGRGALAVPAARAVGASGEVVAVDAAPRMVELLRATAPANVAAYVMDAERLTLADASFDTVLCGFALHLFTNPDRALAGIHRVLRRGGTFAFSTVGAPYVPGPWDFYGELLGEFSALIDDPYPARQHDELADLCRQAGFTGVTSVVDEVRLELRDAAAFWDWHQSHGAASFVEGLSPAAREQFRRRLLAGVEELRRAEGRIMLDRSALFYRMTA